MVRIPIEQLEPGMTLAAPVRHPQAGKHVLLQAGYITEEATIARLTGLKIVDVWIRHSGFDFLDQRLSDEIPESRVRLFESVKRTFSGISDKTVGAFNLLEYRSVVGNLVMALIANKNNAVFAEQIMENDDELFTHCANVAYLSLIIAMHSKQYVAEQRKCANHRDAVDFTNLGIGAMLHDLGKLGLDPEYRDVHFHDPAAESDEYRSHAERGYRAVQGRVESTAAYILLHHHQRFDGTGFPSRARRDGERELAPLKATNIHIFARIVAVANALDSLTRAARRRQQPTVNGLKAVQQSEYHGMFDPVLLDAALRSIPPFPLGSTVGLSDGREAVVTDVVESLPCHPTAHLLYLSTEDDTESEEIDLSQPGAPTIVTAGGREVARDSLYTLSEKPIPVPLAM